jgi:neutral ceramidase
MMLKKILRYLLIGILTIIGLLVLLIVFSIAPVDRTPVQELPAYTSMKEELKRMDTVSIIPATKSFSVGFAKVNLTPAYPTALAVYGSRKGKVYTSVHDSIYVRTLVVDNGTRKAAIVSADLQLIPPEVTLLLKTKLAAVGFSLNNTYLGATHTHSSIGNWGKGVAGFLSGSYKDSVVNFIADQIVLSVKEASLNIKPSQIKAGVIPIPDAVDNRMIEGGPEDPLLRVIEIHRSDSSKLLFMSYTAHATCLFSKDLELSRDYPGKLVDTMESKGYSFAMFMAGAVASHKCSAPEAGTSCIGWMAEKISAKVLATRKQLKTVSDSCLWMIRVPLTLSDPQIKIAPDWKVRAWLFRLTFGEYPVYLTALRLGDVILLGTPCDFSGEFDPRLDAFSANHGLQTMVTSFNGGYIGYVTPVSRYDVHHYETQLMNWYSPGTGEYMEECMEKLVDILDK